MAKKNYSYGKLENGELVYAPNILLGVLAGDDGEGIPVQIINGSAEQYAENGWLPIVRSQSPAPREDGYYQPSYTENDGSIVEAWTFVPYDESTLV